MTVLFDDLEAAELELREGMQLIIAAGGKKLFPLDFLVWAAANRSLGLIAAFRHLLESKTYLTAAALVRLELDTALRLMAAWHVLEPHVFARPYFVRASAFKRNSSVRF